MEHFIRGTTELDAKLIPSKVLENAKGIAIITMVKAGALWTGRAGSGIVVSRLSDGSWSAPSCIMAAGVGFGAQIGAEITDYVFILNNPDAVRAFTHKNISIGGNLSYAAGPTGRALEAAGTVGNLAPIYSYSKSKGVFAGVSLEGTLILTRKKANRLFYGPNTSAKDLLSGKIAPPTQAEPLYRVLNDRFATLNSAFLEQDIRQSEATIANIPLNYGKPLKPSGSVVSSKNKQAKALYDFHAQQQGDLSFRAGQTITVTEAGKSNDWWKGTLNGLTGYFPATYVELL